MLKHLKIFATVFFFMGLVACGRETPDQNRGPLELPRSAKADGTFSCVGACGGQAVGGCWCDDGCAAYGDCCPDNVSVCSAPKPEPPVGGGSAPACSGSCGGKSPQGCWCDDTCAAYGDCCPDIQQSCGSPSAPVSNATPCQGVCSYGAHCSDYCPVGASCIQVVDDGPVPYWKILGC